MAAAYVCRDRYTGTELARPELDRLRDGAQVGAFDAVLVHDPDRLSRKYAYQILILEEFERLGIPPCVSIVVAWPGRIGGGSPGGERSDPEGEPLAPLALPGMVANPERSWGRDRDIKDAIFQRFPQPDGAASGRSPGSLGGTTGRGGGRLPTYPVALVAAGR